jgi:hypothetical protein
MQDAAERQRPHFVERARDLAAHMRHGRRDGDGHASHQHSVFAGGRAGLVGQKSVECVAHRMPRVPQASAHHGWEDT